MRSIPSLARTAALASVLALGPAAAAAQQMDATPARTGVSLAPYIGIYAPTNDLVRAAVDGQDVALRQKVGITFGGRLGVWFSQRLGFEADVGYVPGTFQLTSTQLEMDEDANLLTGSGKLVYRITSPQSAVALAVSGGVGFIKRGGEAYRDLEDDTDVGGVAGLSARFRLGRALALHLSVDDYMYNVTYTETGETPISSERFQHDLRFAFGIGLPFLGFGL